MSPQPSLRPSSTFVESVVNGDSSSLRGVLADGEFELQVIQQPPDQPGFIAPVDGTVTQFAMAAKYGIVGLLAHDNLSGAYFTELRPGQHIELVYGDGHTVAYRVMRLLEYQATDPNSLTSNFIDLAAKTTISADQLFNRVYRGPEHVTLQTCITKDGNPSWGRLFVLALPETPASVIIPAAEPPRHRKQLEGG